MQTRKRRMDTVPVMLFRYVVLAMGMLSVAAMSADVDDMVEKVNLNQADAQVLEYIPGIGAAKATAIIALREQNGGFKQFEDLLEARGIGVKILQDIKAYGTLTGGVTELSQKMLDNPPSKKVTAAHSDPNSVEEVKINAQVSDEMAEK